MYNFSCWFYAQDLRWLCSSMPDLFEHTGSAPPRIPDSGGGAGSQSSARTSSARTTVFSIRSPTKTPCGTNLVDRDTGFSSVFSLPPLSGTWNVAGNSTVIPFQCVFPLNCYRGVPNYCTLWQRRIHIFVGTFVTEYVHLLCSLYVNNTSLWGIHTKSPSQSWPTTGILAAIRTIVA